MHFWPPHVIAVHVYSEKNFTVTFTEEQGEVEHATVKQGYMEPFKAVRQTRNMYLIGEYNSFMAQIFKSLGIYLPCQQNKQLKSITAARKGDLGDCKPAPRHCSVCDDPRSQESTFQIGKSMFHTILEEEKNGNSLQHKPNQTVSPRIQLLFWP